MKIITRQQARDKGLKQYYTGKPCTHGHIAHRYVNNFNCVDCTNIRVNKWIKDNKDQKREHGRKAQRKFEKTAAGKALWKKARERYKVKHRDKILARQVMLNAVRDGRLVKLPCKICGRHKVEGHHSNYTKPLKVVWLCSQHHRELHAQI